MKNDDENVPRNTGVPGNNLGKKLVPLQIDAWLASSLLQKAIRRGETELAQRAALTYFRLRGQGIWRRLMVIAFEDIAAQAVDVLVTTVGAGEPEWREKIGGDSRAIELIVGMLSDAAKDRSSDYLVCSVISHPHLAPLREETDALSIEDRLDLVTDQSLPITTRAIAAMGLVADEYQIVQRKRSWQKDRLFETFSSLRVPAGLVEAVGKAAWRTQEPITIMAPLLWLEMSRDRGGRVRENSLPVSPTVRGIPLYSFDMHTAVGKEAIRRFALENDTVRELLSSLAKHDIIPKAANIAAFYADAAPIARQYSWTLSSELERLGMEADFYAVGIQANHIDAVMNAVNSNLDHLNSIRAELYGGQKRN